jgi:hypothetical protein
MNEGHISKRWTAVGRWLPALFYTANLLLWFLAGVEAGLTDLLWLVALPLSALGLYFARTRRKPL